MCSYYIIYVSFVFLKWTARSWISCGNFWLLQRLAWRRYCMVELGFSKDFPFFIVPNPAIYNLSRTLYGAFRGWRNRVLRRVVLLLWKDDGTPSASALWRVYEPFRRCGIGREDIGSIIIIWAVLTQIVLNFWECTTRRVSKIQPNFQVISK